MIRGEASPSPRECAFLVRLEARSSRRLPSRLSSLSDPCSSKCLDTRLKIDDRISPNSRTTGEPGNATNNFYLYSQCRTRRAFLWANRCSSSSFPTACVTITRRRGGRGNELACIIKKQRSFVALDARRISGPETIRIHSSLINNYFQGKIDRTRKVKECKNVEQFRTISFIQISKGNGTLFLVIYSRFGDSRKFLRLFVHSFFDIYDLVTVVLFSEIEISCSLVPLCDLSNCLLQKFIIQLSNK